MSVHINENDAFALYVGMGSARSYSAVAAHYGVCKRTMVKIARREEWSRRLKEIEEIARNRCDEKLGETLAETQERHLRLVRAVAMRAAKAIADHPLATGYEGVKSMETAIRLERLILGQPNERATVSVEQATKAEIDRFLVKPGEDAPDDEGDDDTDDGDGEY